MSQNEAQNDPNQPSWMAMPDIQEGPVDFACWLCQREDPNYTLELLETVTGTGRIYQLCGDCVERLIGQLEEGEPDNESD